MSLRVAPEERSGGVVAPAIRDLLEHPIPLIAANVAWGVLAFVAWTAWLVSPVAGLAASVPLAWAAAAVAGVAGRITRDRPVSIRDAFRWPISRAAVWVLGLGAAVAALVAIVDLAAALDRDDVLGAGVATLAVWGLVALGVLACVAWPLVGDPLRAGMGTRRLLRLAITVAFLHTLRVTVTALGVLAVLALSALLVAPLLTVSLALVALVLCRVVLPLADAHDPPAEPAADPPA